MTNILKSGKEQCSHNQNWRTPTFGVDIQQGSFSYWAVITIMALAFLALNVLSPEYHDDFVYKFMFEGGSVNYDHPVRSLGDIFASQVEHYHSVNGRSIVHFLVQLFTAILGKPVFNILNVVVFVAFVALLMRGLPRRDGSYRLFGFALTLFLILLLPRFKDTFLWMTGSINYLWSATAALFFLMIYEKRRHRMPDWTLAALLPVSFLLGWTHEGIALPLAASLLITAVPDIRKNHGKSQGSWLVLAFFAGGCMAAFAPGIIARSGVEGGLSPSALGLKAVAALTVMGKLRLVYLALLLVGVSWWLNRGAMKRVLARDGYLILAMLLSLMIILVSGQTMTRAAFGLELFSLMLVLRLIGEVMPGWNAQAVKWGGIALLIALAVFYGLLLRHTVPSWQESRNLIVQIERTNDGIIGTNEHKAGMFSSYVCTMLSLDSTANAMNYDPNGWPASIAATYSRDSLVFLPQAFLDNLKAHADSYDTLSKNTPFEFYVQRIDDVAVIESVTFELAPNDFSEVPIILRPIAHRMNRYTDTTVTTTKWTTVTLYGNRYLLIKRDHDLDKRLLDVRVNGLR